MGGSQDGNSAWCCSEARRTSLLYTDPGDVGGGEALLIGVGARLFRLERMTTRDFGRSLWNDAVAALSRKRNLFLSSKVEAASGIAANVAI